MIAWQLSKNLEKVGEQGSENLKKRPFKVSKTGKYGRVRAFVNISTLYMSILWGKGISPGFRKTERKTKIYPWLFFLANGRRLQNEHT